LGDGPQPEPHVVAAAALAVVRARAAASRFPTGWRNNPSQLHRQAVGDHEVRYQFDRTDELVELHVDGEPVLLDQVGRDAIERVDTAIVGGTVFVAGGQFAFDVPPRFVLPDDAGRAGSTVSPMPGRVVRILVTVGTNVSAGQPMLTIEAMKMEHQIVAPHDGTVSEVYVQAGEQLDGGQPLLKVDPT